MLAFFGYKRTFNEVSVTIYVDREQRSAEMVIKEGRLIRRTVDVPLHEVETPDHCGRYLSEQVNVQDGTLSRLEYLDWCQRRGIHPFERKVNA